MKNLVNIKLHGALGKGMKKSNWKLAVSSVAEAINAINNLTNDKLKKLLIRASKNDVKYNVLINDRDFEHDGPVDINFPENIETSELMIKGDYIEKIDIIPVVEGAGDGMNIFTMILGAILIIIGVMLLIATPGSPLGYAFVAAGLALFAAGLANLLSKPPKAGDVGTSLGSYMFNGPQNTSEEGNPVPIGYGRLMVGSQVIAASYDIDYLSADPSDTDYGFHGAA